ncbi:DNA-binding transcription factor [Lithospermum erythrorhizon]|uniref:DNA-binding transcription factor n=1 Tax=Lithospermum erythrorhizon TaxID=34254 RepID=A0AAV3NFX4_LITER
MDSTSSISNNPDTDLNTSRKKKRKIDIDNGAQSSELCSQIDPTRWTNPTNQQIYSSKLVQALGNNSCNGGNEVRDMANRVLATTSKGKTRWSRAILTNQLSMRLNLINRKHKRAKAAKMRSKVARNNNKKKNNKEEVPLLEQKVRVLGRLVPGCKKVPFPSLLEETTDYIGALEMQVRAMTFLTQLLGGAAEAG